MFEIVEKDLCARIGKLYTKSGVIETPAIFPVINPVKQTVPLQEIEEIGYSQVITNAYLIKRHFGELAREVSIHDLLGWKKVIMTDSGAYQLMEYGEIETSPDEILQFQVETGSDIGVILDIPTRGDTPREQVLIEVEETIRRAKRAIKLREIIDPEHRMLLVGPIQGGTHLDILEYCAREMSKLDFDVYAIGSVTSLLEHYDFKPIIEMIMTVKRVIPEGKPVHLFGAGHPLIIPIAVALGVDLFDSASYILYARDDRIMLPDRTLRLDDVKTDHIPCTCPVCRKYTVKELKEMSKQEREPLIAKHNLYVLLREIEEVKQRIREGTLWEYLYEKAFSNPRVLEAFLTLRKYLDKLVRMTPVTRGDVHGIYVYTMHDMYRPHYVNHVERLVENYEPPSKPILVIIPEVLDERPCNRSTAFTRLCSELTRRGLFKYVHICFFSRVFGIVPHEIADVYPLTQHEYVRNSRELLKLGLEAVKKYFKTHGRKYRYVLLALPEGVVNRVEKTIREVCRDVQIVRVSIKSYWDLVQAVDVICNMVHLLSSSAPPR